MAKGKSKRNFFLVFVVTMLIIYLVRIILVHIIGSRGIAFFAPANEIYFFIAFSVAYGIENGVAYLVDSRNQRQMFSNAKTVFRAGIILALGLGIVLAAVLFAVNGFLSTTCFNIPRANVSLYVILPAILFTFITAAFRGYFNGSGLRNITNISYFVFAGSYLVFSLAFSVIFLGTGGNVADLLRLEDYKYAYGAIGATVGVSAAALVTMLHAIVIYILYSRRTVFNEDRDYSRSYESPQSLILSIIKNGLFEFATVGAFFFIELINSIGMLLGSSVDDLIFVSFGEFYGKVFPIIILTILILGFTTFPYVKKSVSALNREEYRNSRERLDRMIHRCSTLGFFISGMMIVLGGDILNIVFKTNLEFTFNAMMIEGVCVVFGIFALIMTKLLCMLRYSGLAGVICAVAAVIDAVLCFVFGKIFGATGVMLCNLIFLAIIALISFGFVTKAFQYTQEWYRSFLISIIGSLAASIVGLLINKAILNIGNHLIAFIVSLVFSILIYMVVLLILRGYYSDELQESFWGRIMLIVGRIAGLL